MRDDHLAITLACVLFALSAIAVTLAWSLGECEQNTQPEVELLFELCGNGAPLVKDGEMYMVVCIPMMRDK